MLLLRRINQIILISLGIPDENFWFSLAEELSGIFVKSISEGSAADLSNKIQINDRIVEVDGHSLQGYTNHEAVEVLRRTGQTVTLCLERYLRGPKFEQLQQAIAASELRLPQPSSPSITSLPSFPMSAVRSINSCNLIKKGKMYFCINYILYVNVCCSCIHWFKFYSSPSCAYWKFFNYKFQIIYFIYLCIIEIIVLIYNCLIYNI